MKELVSFRCPEEYKTIINLLIQHGMHKNQTDAILFGLRLLRDYHKLRVKLEDHEALDYLDSKQDDKILDLESPHIKNFLNNWKRENLPKKALDLDLDLEPAEENLEHE